ncbi:MAG TPA: hypothetical protein VEW90_10710 [Gaiellaceae bacterium]|nr:hypothetical protein [Gaiellaceae bacterium]
MRLCMFHPVGHPLERGWVGRVDGDRVVQLAAQTLQSFFSGGGSAREHAEYPLSEVVLLAPVLHPPSVRLFDEAGSFAFANPAAIVGPGAEIPCTDQSQGLVAALRVAVVVGAGSEIGGFTLLAEWRDPARRPPKDRDFALGLGPVVVTPDEFVDGAGFDWPAATALAAAGTRLHPGDVLAGPVREQREVRAGESVSLEVDGIGALEERVTG